ncbi:MAG TPA: hypothetical protein VFF00_03640 [Candidatus Elarobacter sp.]|nr:hypothetical protein [Candidatus Elarobacter sp.]
MPSSAGSNRAQRRPGLALAAVALAALALALALAYASTLQWHPRASGTAALPETPAARFGASAPAATTSGTRRAPATAQPVAAPAGAEPERATGLWTLLTPWALAVDALALLGLALALASRRAAPGRRGARR